jgi:hypothetical protein
MGPPAKKKAARVAPRLDAANLGGITSLMNPQHVKGGVDLEVAEKTVMGKGAGGSKKTDGDPVRIYTAELTQLAEELGIDLLGDGDPAGAPAPRTPALGGEPRSSHSAHSAHSSHAPPKPAARASAEPPRSAARAPAPSRHSREAAASLMPAIDLGDDSSGDDDDEGDSSGDSDGSDAASGGSGGGSGSGSGSECDCDSNCGDDCDCGCHSDGSDDGSDGSETGSEAEPEGDDEKVDSIIARLEDELGIRSSSKREKRRHKVAMVAVPVVERRRSDRHGVTDEQDRRRHINSIIGDIRGETRTTFGVERERVQDIKASKLDQIGQLRVALEEEDIDCSAVSKPTAESPMEEIDSVLSILRLKNDRNRYSSMAEEVIIGGAEFVETVFDGTRAIPLLGWRPDYTNYSATVNAKLHRMRFETAQLVGSIIEKYNIGSTWRIAMELLPSFFLYPRQQRKQRGAPGLANDPHVADARHAHAMIRASDEPKNLADVRRI